MTHGSIFSLPSPPSVPLLNSFNKAAVEGIVPVTSTLFFFWHPACTSRSQWSQVAPKDGEVMDKCILCCPCVGWGIAWTYENVDDLFLPKNMFVSFDIDDILSDEPSPCGGKGRVGGWSCSKLVRGSTRTDIGLHFAVSGSRSSQQTSTIRSSGCQ